MFYCEPCRDKNEWPGIIQTSRGRCEMCGNTGPCYDTPSKDLPAPEVERLYLRCDPCGEVFDTLTTARDHELTDENRGFGHEYTIVPESEAF